MMVQSDEQRVELTA